MKVPDELLRPALEVAWAVAVYGAQQRPPVAPPPSLRPLLKFQKLPPQALGTLRRAVEKDDEFRSRLTTIDEHAAEELMGRPSWLWLYRPEGWEADLAALVEAEEAAGDGRRTRARSGADALDRVAAGRLDRAEARVRQQTAELEVLRAEVRKAADARELAEQERARVKARADELERAASRLRARVEREASELEEVRDAAAAAREEAAALRAELSVAELKIAELQVAELQTSELQTTELDRGADVDDSTGSAAVHVGGVPSSAPVPVLPISALDALGAAASAAADLADALAVLAGSLAHRPVPARPEQADREMPPNPARVPMPVGQRRVALRIPRGMRAGTRRADAWLLTEAGARVIVDGYNVAKLGWPDQPLSEQRDRLVDVLEDLAVRHHARIEVVFDGAHAGTVHQSRRRHVRTRFSPAGVLADDVIRELVAAEPAENPVVVVTDDREVVDDVRALGANVVASAGLLAVRR